jgi:hypothetical protein
MALPPQQRHLPKLTCTFAFKGDDSAADAENGGEENFLFFGSVLRPCPVGGRMSRGKRTMTMQLMLMSQNILARGLGSSKKNLENSSVPLV